MNEIEPRFEFRAWARNFGMVETRMRRLSRCRGISETNELYIVSSGADESNLKIRNDKLDLKVLVQEWEGLEQWQPRKKSTFPITADALGAEVLPTFGFDMPALDRDEYTLRQFLDEIIRPHRDLVAANVFKRRFRFTVNDCMSELAQVWINGAGLQTVAVESAEKWAVLEANRMLGLHDYENVNYLRAIKRVVGMAPLPASF